ncbi:MAG: hypothetical protein HQK63_16620 [Desulfamplus sp.]|nr:hypothetical protein [Desulfamplus sp.]
MTIKDLIKLYETRKKIYGKEAYRYISSLLAEAKTQHKKDFKGADHEQSWRAFKGKNLEKLIEHIITDEVRSLGLEVVNGNSLERTKGENLSKEMSLLKRNLLIDYGEYGSHLPDVIKNDARRIPLNNDSVDFVFIDSPYSDNISYSNDIRCIGKISCEKQEFFDELEKVAKEIHRILKPNKAVGWLIGDQWKKKKFIPTGFLLYQRLEKYFETIDTICVTRRNQTSNTDIWHNRAIQFNFYLRGFKYLFIMSKK